MLDQVSTEFCLHAYLTVAVLLGPQAGVVGEVG